MKKIILITILVFIIVACGSDNLSNSKAKGIISDCLKTKPEQRTANFRIGKSTFSKQDHDQALLQKYIKLAEDGYLEMKLIKEITKGWNKGTKEYSIKLNEKALKYMEDVPENGGNASAKTYNYKVDKVLEVQEKPALNMAIVKVQYKAEDITPFAILSRKDPSEFWIKDLNMVKTSNGWKYCDQF